MILQLISFAHFYMFCKDGFWRCEFGHSFNICSLHVYRPLCKLWYPYRALNWKMRESCVDPPHPAAAQTRLIEPAVLKEIPPSYKGIIQIRQNAKGKKWERKFSRAQFPHHRWGNWACRIKRDPPPLCIKWTVSGSN